VKVNGALMLSLSMLNWPVAALPLMGVLVLLASLAVRPGARRTRHTDEPSATPSRRRRDSQPVTVRDSQPVTVEVRRLDAHRASCHRSRLPGTYAGVGGT
jgi:hypothetical protein